MHSGPFGCLTKLSAKRAELVVAKMASHAIFQYNVLAIDDTHNTWTNMIVKINIPRLLGSSDDKEKIGAARLETEDTLTGLTDVEENVYVGALADEDR